VVGQKSSNISPNAFLHNGALKTHGISSAALRSMAIFNGRLSDFQPSQGFGFDGNLGAHHRGLGAGFRRKKAEVWLEGFGINWVRLFIILLG